MIKVWTINVFCSSGDRVQSAQFCWSQTERSDPSPETLIRSRRRHQEPRVQEGSWGSLITSVWFSSFQMYSASRAENLRLRTEIDDLRNDLEAANRNLDFAFHVSAVVLCLSPLSAALFWCWMRQQSKEVLANNIWLIAGVCQELGLRHREKGEESGGEKAFEYSGSDKGLRWNKVASLSVQTF